MLSWGFWGPQGFYFGLRPAGFYARLAIFILRLLWIFLYLRTRYTLLSIYIYSGDLVCVCIVSNGIVWVNMSSILIIVLLDYLLPLNCGQKPYRQLKNWKKNEGNENAFVAFEFLLYSWNVLILFSLAFRVYFLNWIFYSWIAWFFPTSVCCFCFFVLVFVLCEFH